MIPPTHKIKLHQVLTWCCLCLMFLVLSACRENSGEGGGEPVAPRPVAEAVDARLVVSPESGYAGTYVNVEGSGWPADAVITVMIADERGHSGILVAASADVDGRFSTGFLYPLADRWLTPGAHAVIAQTSSGEIQAQGNFTVVPPEAVDAPTAVPTETQTASSPNTPTPIPTPVETPTLTATPVVVIGTPVSATPIVEATNTPLPTPAPTALPAVVNQPPLIQAALEPVQVEKSKGLFAVVAEVTDPEGQLASQQAVIEVRRLDARDEIKLKRHEKKVHIKWNANKLEIQAPDPEAILAQLRTWNGIPVEHGQWVELELTDGGDQEFEYKEDRLRIKAPALLLKVSAQDAEGAVSTLSVVPRFTEVTQEDNKEKKPKKDKNKEKDDENEDEDEDD